MADVARGTDAINAPDIHQRTRALIRHRVARDVAINHARFENHDERGGFFWAPIIGVAASAIASAAASGIKSAASAGARAVTSEAAKTLGKEAAKGAASEVGARVAGKIADATIGPKSGGGDGGGGGGGCGGRTYSRAEYQRQRLMPLVERYRQDRAVVDMMRKQGVL